MFYRWMLPGIGKFWHGAEVLTLSLAFGLGFGSDASIAQEAEDAYEILTSIDVSGYHVEDPLAGYFDAPARRAYLARAESPELQNWIDVHMLGKSCQAVMALPVPDHEIVLPGFYVDNTAWREMVQVFLEFEDAMSALSAAETVLNDGYHADCIVDVLLQWARAGALEEFVYSEFSPQAWYTTESTLFSIAFALMSVRDIVVESRSDDLAEIDAWLVAVALRHSSISGLPSRACCNNHLYRRGVYAMAIGIMARHDQLYQFGVRSFMLALHEAEEDGHLPMEMLRGRRAVHYQNFATMYLVMLAEMMERQGIRAYSIEIDGVSIHDIAGMALDLTHNPELVRALGVDDEQVLLQMTDSQYLSWLEPYFARTADPRARTLMEGRRPLYNRSLGGATSLLFYRPEIATN
ncbi:alginate lyase family protein [Gymnodinialimonas ceratoperidinii]|uniref:Alginate lyase family protein n=1 Tax=Gymnodinialimonas ceratoperidinii TaxID=2856823 RepID=A0A8F6YBF2_9RHOB|nr:alginate lyase family protein [Gymnodinialimonas ceratoperidinii]QXT38140.1 alginate lyase family protein [Gymnodinialimonas ceratoperidinii]